MPSPHPCAQGHSTTPPPPLRSAKARPRDRPTARPGGRGQRFPAERLWGKAPAAPASLPPARLGSGHVSKQTRPSTPQRRRDSPSAVRRGRPWGGRRPPRPAAMPGAALPPGKEKEKEEEEEEQHWRRLPERSRRLALKRGGEGGGWRGADPAAGLPALPANNGGRPRPLPLPSRPAPRGARAAPPSRGGGLRLGRGCGATWRAAPQRRHPRPESAP